MGRRYTAAWAFLGTDLESFLLIHVCFQICLVLGDYPGHETDPNESKKAVKLVSKSYLLFAAENEIFVIGFGFRTGHLE